MLLVLSLLSLYKGFSERSERAEWEEKSLRPTLNHECKAINPPPTHSHNLFVSTQDKTNVSFKSIDVLI